MPGTDATLPELGDFRWLTVSPPGQEDVAIVLMAIPGEPVMDTETKKQIEELMAKGFAGTVMLEAIGFGRATVKGSVVYLHRAVPVAQGEIVQTGPACAIRSDDVFAGPLLGEGLDGAVGQSDPQGAGRGGGCAHPFGGVASGPACRAGGWQDKDVGGEFEGLGLLR